MVDQLFVFILLIHFLGDFVLQTDWQAKNKSSSLNALNRHVLSYSTVWGLAAFVYFGNIGTALSFMFITYVAHFATDYVTSRQVKKIFRCRRSPYWFYSNRI